MKSSTQNRHAKNSTKIGQARIPTGLQKTTSTRSVLHRHVLKSSMNTAGIQYCRKGIGQRTHRCTARKWQLMTVCITQTQYRPPWHGIQIYHYCTIIIISFFFQLFFVIGYNGSPSWRYAHMYQKSTAVLICLPNQSPHPPSPQLTASTTKKSFRPWGIHFTFFD